MLTVPHLVIIFQNSVELLPICSSRCAGCIHVWLLQAGAWIWCFCARVRGYGKACKVEHLSEHHFDFELDLPNVASAFPDLSSHFSQLISMNHSRGSRFCGNGEAPSYQFPYSQSCSLSLSSRKGCLHVHWCSMEACFDVSLFACYSCETLSLIKRNFVRSSRLFKRTFFRLFKVCSLVRCSDQTQLQFFFASQANLK